MASYTYRAIDDNSNILSGRLQARDESELEKRLGGQGLTLIESTRTSILDFGKGSPLRFHAQELLDFTYMLYLIISSGLPIMGGLNDLMKNQARKKIARAAELLYGKIESGLSLSEAMWENPQVFPDYFVHMIKAGEASGTLDRSLQYLMSYIEWQINFRKSVRSALVYPTMVLGAMALLITVIFTFVFPKLISILTGLNTELPLPTRIVVAVIGIFNKYFLLAAAGIVAGFILLKLWGKTYNGRRAVDRFILSLPLIGDLSRKINLSRYLKTLATLYASGLSIDRTFSIASGVVRNAVISDALNLVTDSVMTGEGIAQAMAKTGVFPAIVVDMIAIGEKTSSLDNTLQRASDIFDKEVPETIRKVFSYIEPLTIIMLGGLVLLVLLSIFLPIYKIAGSIRGR
ncbi:MAG: type II secretion system F family protein [Thermodesulfovibrionales bacterium]